MEIIFKPEADILSTSYTRPLSNETDIIPLSFRTESVAIHQMEIAAEAIPEGLEIVLVDKYLNDIIPVTDNFAYTFNSAEGSFSDRFEVAVSFSVITALENDELNGISYTVQNSQLTLKAANAIQSIRLFDLVGKEIYSQTFTVPSVEASIPISPFHIYHSLFDEKWKYIHPKTSP